MKKFLSVILFCLLLAGLSGVVYLQSSSRETRQNDLTKNCATKKTSAFASERAHGVILRDRTIATVRLEGEKNFSPPGGHLEEGETPKQALARELKEELGISADPSNFKSFKVYCEVLGATKSQRTYVYFVEKWDKNFSVGSNDQFKWVNYDYRLNADADTELVILLDYLKKDNLID